MCVAANNTAEVTVTLDQLLHTTNDHDLDQLLRRAAEECRYFMYLDVSWDYWHYGRHAEYAAALGLTTMSRLFSASWQIQYRVHDVDEQTAEDERNKIRRDYSV